MAIRNGRFLREKFVRLSRPLDASEFVVNTPAYDDETLWELLCVRQCFRVDLRHKLLPAQLELVSDDLQQVVW